MILYHITSTPFFNTFHDIMYPSRILVRNLSVMSEIIEIVIKGKNRGLKKVTKTLIL